MAGKNTEQLDLLPPGTPPADLLLQLRDKQRGRDFRFPYEQVVGLDNRGPNLHPSGGPCVTYYDATTPHYQAGDSTLLALAGEMLHIGSRASVEYDSAGNHLEWLVVYDALPRTPGTGLLVYQDGRHTGNRLPGKWVRSDSAEAFVTPYASVDGTTYAWEENQYTSAYVTGQSTLQFFAARTAGIHPAPTTGGDVTHWEAVSDTDIPRGSTTVILPPVTVRDATTATAYQRLPAALAANTTDFTVLLNLSLYRLTADAELDGGTLLGNGAVVYLANGVTFSITGAFVKETYFEGGTVRVHSQVLAGIDYLFDCFFAFDTTLFVPTARRATLEYCRVYGSLSIAGLLILRPGTVVPDAFWASLTANPDGTYTTPQGGTVWDERATVFTPIAAFAHNSTHPAFTTQHAFNIWVLENLGVPAPVGSASLLLTPADLRYNVAPIQPTGYAATMALAVAELNVTGEGTTVTVTPTFTGTAAGVSANRGASVTFDGTFLALVLAGGTFQLPAFTGSKRLTINMGHAEGPGDSAVGSMSGQYVSQLDFAGATALKVAVPYATQMVAFITDSLNVGYGSGNPGRYAPPSLLRTTSRDTIQLGYSGMQFGLLLASGNRPGLIVQLKAALTHSTDKRVWLQGATNDYNNNTVTPSQLTTRLSALLDELTTDTFFDTAKIYLCSATITGYEGNTNSLGASMADYRAAWLAAATGRANVMRVSGPSLVSATYLLSDLTHLTAAGYAAEAEAQRLILEGSFVPSDGSINAWVDIDDDDPAIVVSGMTKDGVFPAIYAAPNHSGYYTDQLGGFIRFTGNISAFEFWSPTDTGLGKLTVKVDGIVVSGLDANGSPATDVDEMTSVKMASHALFILEGLTPGPHVVEFIIGYIPANGAVGFDKLRVRPA